MDVFCYFIIPNTVKKLFRKLSIEVGISVQVLFIGTKTYL